MRVRLFRLFIILGFCAFIAAEFDALDAPISLLSSWFKGIDHKFPGLPGGIVGAILTATVAWIALRTNAAVNIRNKRIDVILHCNARYDELYKLRNELEKEESKSIKGHMIRSYFRRYWGLQSDQIDYWLAGYVDPETMSSWIVSLSGSLNGKSVGNRNLKISYRDSWEEVKDSHKVVNERLRETVAFASDVISRLKSSEDKYAVTLHYLRIIEANERSLIKRLSRNHHSRMFVDELATTIRRPYWSRYNAFDSRYPPFRLLYRLGAMPARLMATLPDWLEGNRLERLSGSIPSVIDESTGEPESNPISKSDT